MSGEVEKCPILHVRPKFDVFTLIVSNGKILNKLFGNYSLWYVSDYIISKSLRNLLGCFFEKLTLVENLNMYTPPT